MRTGSSTRATSSAAASAAAPDETGGVLVAVPAEHGHLEGGRGGDPRGAQDIARPEGGPVVGAAEGGGAGGGPAPAANVVEVMSPWSVPPGAVPSPAGRNPRAARVRLRSDAVPSGEEGPPGDPYGAAARFLRGGPCGLRGGPRAAGGGGVRTACGARHGTLPYGRCGPEPRLRGGAARSVP